MVAAVIMLVILCQRKQRKNKQTQVTEKPDVTVTAEELYKENDRNSNISDLKLELRQANGSCEIVSMIFCVGISFCTWCGFGEKGSDVASKVELDVANSRLIKIIKKKTLVWR